MPNIRLLRPSAARLLLAACALLVCLPAGAAHARAKGGSLKVALPAEGEASVAFAKVKDRGHGRAPSLRVAKAPAGLTVTGAVSRRGQIAVAVVRPRGKGGSRSANAAAAAGASSVVLSLKGAKPSGVKVAAGVLASGAGAPKGLCAGSTLAGQLGRSIARGALSPADAKALGAVLASRACGKPLAAEQTALLARLGLGAGAGAPTQGATVGQPAGKPGPIGSAGSRPVGGPGGGGSPGGGGNPGGGTNQCTNGIDDDGDGQVDALDSGQVRPDPGCETGDGRSESGEVAVSDECANSSGVGQGDDRTALFAGLNSGCGTYTDVWVNLAPAAASCTALTSESNFSCKIVGGNALASTTNDKATDLVDMPITLTGPADCDVPATVAFFGDDGSVRELVEPIGSCKTGEEPPPAPQCSNGKDDDGDGQADSPDAAGATDPDPGCKSSTDDSEDSEVDLPDGCTVNAGTIGGDARFTGASVAGCGAITGVWFKAPGQPTDCGYVIGQGTPAACDVFGVTGVASFDETSSNVVIGTHIDDDPTCQPITVAIQLADGSVAEGRGNWC